MNISFREGSLDEFIFHEIFIQDVYRLPNSFTDHDIILDIGAHIGLFTLAVLQRGAKCVYAVEPDSANYKIAENHLKNYIKQGQVFLSRQAVWRSDTNEELLYCCEYPVFGTSINTGAVNVIWQKHGQAVPVLPFDTLVSQATENGKRRIRLLKLDCEGSEWPILFTSNSLHLVDEIKGEFHEVGGEYDSLSLPFTIGDMEHYTVHDLISFLEKKGFRVTYQRWQIRGKPWPIGTFFAVREVFPC